MEMSKLNLEEILRAHRSYGMDDSQQNRTIPKYKMILKLKNLNIYNFYP